MKNNYVLAIVVGVIVLAANQVLNALLGIILPALKTEYAASVFKSGSGPLNFLVFLYLIADGVLLTYLWLKTRKSWKNGIDFGVTVGLLMAIPLFIVNYSTFTFSMLLVGTWSFFYFVNVLVAGLALERLEG